MINDISGILQAVSPLRSDQTSDNASASVQPSIKPTSVADVTARLLGTREFLREVGTQGGFRKEIMAFHERWIAGQGCPQVTAAFTFHKWVLLLEHSRTTKLLPQQASNKE